MLCRIFEKSGIGPPNGDWYGPFFEEEWDDEEALIVPVRDTMDDVANDDETCAEGNNTMQVLCCFTHICVSVYVRTFTLLSHCPDSRHQLDMFVC